MFPEYATAKEHFDEGRFSRAITDYQRIFEIIHGFNSAQCNQMLLEVSIQLANSYLLNGNADKANKLLKSASEVTTITDHELLVLELFRSKAFQWKGKFSESLERAQVATNILEQLEDADLRHFTDAYGQLGLAHLLHNDVEEAEGFFQMSARWAQTPTQKLRSIANYGSVQWYRAAHAEKPFSIWAHQLQMIRITPQEFFQQFIQAADAAKLRDVPGQIVKTEIAKAAHVVAKKPWIQDEQTLKMVQFALEVWQDGVNEFTSSHLSSAGGSPSAAATAAAMCGPIGKTDDRTKMTMTGLIGDDVRTVPSSQKASVDSKPDTPVVPLETFLQQNADAALAYAHLLTNIAEAQEILSQSSEASHTLSSALKAVAHITHSPQSQPIIGRILKWIAYHHARASQNVSAEGLCRSALDKLSTSASSSPTNPPSHQAAFAQHDLRYQFEGAIARGLYAQVLGNWERREVQGLQLQKEVLQSQLPPLLHPTLPNMPLLPPQFVYLV
jgi:tetratricopeptide (TPR) repeat protein